LLYSLKTILNELTFVLIAAQLLLFISIRQQLMRDLLYGWPAYVTFTITQGTQQAERHNDYKVTLLVTQHVFLRG